VVCKFEDSLPSKTPMNGHTDSCSTNGTAAILRRLRRQNIDLSLAYSEPDSKSSSPKGVLHVLGMDDASVKALKTQNIKPYYNMRHMAFVLSRPTEKAVNGPHS
jgi:hypothetical protein